MQTTTYNTEQTAVIIKPTGNPARQQIFHVKTFKILGGVQIGLGLILVILSFVELIAISSLLFWTIPILLCSVWFVVTGCLPMRMSKNTESSLKCQKIWFMVCSIIGAAVFFPVMFNLSFFVGLSDQDNYRNDWYIVSFSITALSVAEALVAVISASYCCCCSPWETSSQADVCFKSQTQLGMNPNAAGNHIQDTNIRPWTVSYSSAV
ncbi:uncharacterized protein LOC127701693 [Mytilus californianus]|uniref:uncharacterized protein LOC127701693 n=1 Tax=Mytilus californianus TaxID=6549 RepID=UPI002245B46E|nr:uncharacterized protein LOC127701693 [Mytilus californianus]